jgi:NADPH:quinone reductase-like Zn-dependent oxidoreductase
MGALGLSALGVQTVATVEAVGPEVVGFAPGDRVAMRNPGARPGFQRQVSERDLIGIPRDVTFEEAAGVLASGLVARAIVKQIHTVGRGDRVVVVPDESGADAFVAAWARHLGATVVDPADQRPGDSIIGPADFRAGAAWRYGHGLAQLAAADVFKAMRDGAFDALAVETLPLSDAARVHSDIEARRTAGPVVLLPGRGDIAA